MSRNWLQRLNRWWGVILMLAAIVATVWLGAAGRLGLYIHPRYIVFTIIMAAIALFFVVAGLVVKGDHADEPVSGWRLPLRIAGVVVTLAFAAVLIAIPPATLTSATADQRAINSTGVGTSGQSVSAANASPAGAFAKFTVLDWASLLRQTNDPSFYGDKAVDVVGFIAPDTDDPENMFYVTRFVITCCAVDAQPVGVPVYQAHWRDSYKKDEWVRVTGDFGTNPSSASSQSIALVPDTIAEVKQPDDPYLY